MCEDREELIFPPVRLAQLELLTLRLRAVGKPRRYRALQRGGDDVQPHVAFVGLAPVLERQWLVTLGDGERDSDEPEDDHRDDIELVLHLQGARRQQERRIDYADNNEQHAEARSQ